MKLDGAGVVAAELFKSCSKRFSRIGYIFHYMRSTPYLLYSKKCFEGQDCKRILESLDSVINTV